MQLVRRICEINVAVGFLLVIFSPALAEDEPFTTRIEPFLRKHCFSCHDAREAQAGLRLDQLGRDFLAGKTADVWKEVIDRINLGEMPPEEEPRPDAEESFAVVEWVGHELRRAERESRMAGGRVLLRRLNRNEYANTVRDLLRLDQNLVDLVEEELPADGKADGFDRIGSALLFDETQLNSYIEQAGLISAKAIVDSQTPPEPIVERREFERQYRTPKSGEALVQYQKDTEIPLGPAHDINRGDSVEFITSVSYDRQDGFGSFGSLYSFAFPKDNAVPREGYYRIRVRAGAFEGTRGEPIQMKFVYMPGTPLQEVFFLPITGTLEEPRESETVLFLRKPPEDSKPRMQMYWNPIQDVIVAHPEVNELNLRRLRSTGAVSKLIAAGAPEEEIAAAKAEVEAAVAAALDFAKRPDAVTRIYNEKYKLEEVPRIVVDWVEFAGPIEPAWPPLSHQTLLPEGIPQTDAALRSAIAKFLPRAYRRPVSEAEIEEIVRAAARAREEFALDEVATTRYALQTMLVMPQFLMLLEPSEQAAPPRPLNDYELASRLSYLLWSSMPDERLFELAAAGKLRDPAVLRGEVARMIADPKSRAFVENFTGQWLHVRQFGSVMPARDYSQYDKALEIAEQEEPYAFFQEVLRQNLSILNFLDSDFTLVNQRLAEFYGIEGVEGEEFRRVELKPEHQRGGVLTMGGLLTYLADGTRTLPVRRGAFILEEIFNDPPPPPPPNAGEIQPNVQGENLTVRERLERHRNDSTCASCHAKIDPLGLALENYDAIGAWRTVQNGEGFRANRAPPIDASGTLPGGREFTTPKEFKQALLAEKDRFTRAFTEKLLTYSLGRPVGFTDSATIEEVTRAARENEYGLRAMIEAIVVSEPFLTK